MSPWENLRGRGQQLLEPSIVEGTRLPSSGRVETLTLSSHMSVFGEPSSTEDASVEYTEGCWLASGHIMTRFEFCFTHFTVQKPSAGLYTLADLPQCSAVKLRHRLKGDWIWLR
ncbi:hypothetical protein P7K49_000935 [Saguinus oedipus]|uniref:Uncharacterized protein n=1 Tax=Saguinus oedipus TaxID=9490 RepID=A0ABQ9WD17_SAGOE|nr:hypothetical protein P7K49_000935 [Saguinus oedipus]